MADISLSYLGKIQLILGPMFSGKTTELMRRVKRFMVAQQRCLVIKYKKDTRYSDECASTHDLQTLRAGVACAKLEDVNVELLSSVDVVAIDEGQFFPDLTDYCELWANQGKICIVSALDGTFERKPFPSVIGLVSLAEEVMKLSAVCMVCHKEAAFSKRLGTETAIEVIGGADKYVAVCRRCYLRPQTNTMNKRKTPTSLHVTIDSFAIGGGNGNTSDDDTSHDTRHGHGQGHHEHKSSNNIVMDAPLLLVSKPENIIRLTSPPAGAFDDGHSSGHESPSSPLSPSSADSHKRARPVSAIASAH